MRVSIQDARESALSNKSGISYAIRSNHLIEPLQRIRHSVPFLRMLRLLYY